MRTRIRLGLRDTLRPKVSVDASVIGVLSALLAVAAGYSSDPTAGIASSSSAVAPLALDGAPQPDPQSADSDDDAVGVVIADGDDITFYGGARYTPMGKKLGDSGARTASQFPAELIDPHDWYLTLPTGKQGSPDTIDGSRLATYHSKFFQLNPQRNGIMFTAGAGGVTTKNSHYPRTELREMNGSQKADWNAGSGRHTMELVQAITETPKTKPDVIAGQIHDDKDDVMQIMLSGKRLMVRYSQNKTVMLDPNYKLGTKFKVRIEASSGHIRVSYNDQPMADLPITATKSYFKAGSYVNSNPKHGENGSANGQVELYSAQVQHAGGSTRKQSRPR